MSQELAQRNGSVVNPLTVEQIQSFIKNPLLQLPADWVPVVFDFWAFWSDVLKGDLGLCTRVRYWMNEDGLTLDVLRRAMAEEKTATAAAEIHFPSQVLAGLAERIKTIRRADEDAERREKQKQASQPADVIVTNLAEAFRRPGVSPVKPVE